MLSQGFGADEDKAEAIDWMVAAMKQEHPKALFYQALVARRDSHPAAHDIMIDRVQRAAKRGHPKAQFIKSLFGRDAPTNGYWAQLAADQGDRRATGNLLSYIDEELRDISRESTSKGHWSGGFPKIAFVERVGTGRSAKNSGPPVRL